MSNIDGEKMRDTGVWKRLMRNYTLAMVTGLAVLIYVMPQLGSDASRPMMAATLLGGLLIFSGGFGMVVTLFFHFLNKK
ncbi:MAG: hypothetical protein Q9M14_04475 [Mariprofundaceae bacterium]|nr:hypothetical protein [Mariprofundaceae bacterium]